MRERSSLARSSSRARRAPRVIATVSGDEMADLRSCGSRLPTTRQLPARPHAADEILRSRPDGVDVVVEVAAGANAALDSRRVGGERHRHLAHGTRSASQQTWHLGRRPDGSQRSLPVRARTSAGARPRSRTRHRRGRRRGGCGRRPASMERAPGLPLQHPLEQHRSSRGPAVRPPPTTLRSEGGLCRRQGAHRRRRNGGGAMAASAARRC